MSPPVYSILSALIEEKAGLHYGRQDRELLQDKVSTRALEMGFNSLLDYYYFLKHDPDGASELGELIEALVVSETYFFREWPAVEVLVNHFVATWCAAGRMPRIWSAACATGEEPLSLAMLLAENGLLDRVEIVASDISSKALARGKAGQFGKRSVRQVPNQSLVERFIVPTASGYQVSPELIGKINWQQRNLLNPKDFEELGHFDAILCRNVLIYFSEKTVRSVVHSFSESLHKNGVLLVGVSESLLRASADFKAEERGGAFVYRKENH